MEQYAECDRWIRSLINLPKKSADQQPPDLRTLLHLGLYQLHYLAQVPDAIAVDAAVQLAKDNGFKGLAGFVNGVLRQSIREIRATADLTDYFKAKLQNHPLPEKLGILYSFPDWIVKLWLDQFGATVTEQLCDWFNQPPTLDLRVNRLRSSVAEVEAMLENVGVKVTRLSNVPQALRLLSSTGAIEQLPGFQEGFWVIQDGSAQLVSYLLDPQPGELVIDACAAPGGKTTHIAELMRDNGIIWACDRYASRLKKLQQNTQRLGLKSIQLCTGDSRNFPQFTRKADRVLLDAPCSGLGTLHRHADARWRQTPNTVQELAQLQTELLQQTSAWVKPGGVLVYATCTLHPSENEAVIQTFLQRYPEWQIEPPAASSPIASFATPEGWVKVLPHQHQMDGFFMVRLRLN